MQFGMEFNQAQRSRCFANQYLVSGTAKLVTTEDVS
jgi:hypothetical protein